MTKFALFSATKIDLDGIVVFNLNQEFYSKYISSFQGVEEAMANPEVMHSIVLAVRTWSKQIERVRLSYDLYSLHTV